MAARKAAKAKAGSATDATEQEDEALEAGEHARTNPLGHPDRNEVERAAEAAEEAVRMSYRR